MSFKGEATEISSTGLNFSDTTRQIKSSYCNKTLHYVTLKTYQLKIKITISMTLTTDKPSYSNILAAVPQAVEAIQSLSIDDQLGLLWVLYENMGGLVTPAASDASERIGLWTNSKMIRDYLREC